MCVDFGNCGVLSFGSVSTSSCCWWWHCCGGGRGVAVVVVVVCTWLFRYIYIVAHIRACAPAKRADITPFRRLLTWFSLEFRVRVKGGGRYKGVLLGYKGFVLHLCVFLLRYQSYPTNFNPDVAEGWGG